jgi:hypothetical protein
MRFCVLVAFLAALPLSAETPRFTGPDTIRDAGVPIDVTWYGAPVMFDWNLDGAKDLVCGQFTGGYIRFYPNRGPDSAPVFNGFEYLYASGSQITLPSG